MCNTAKKSHKLLELEIVVFKVASHGIKKQRPNVPENTSLTTAISVCFRLIGREMSTLFDFPQFLQGWHIVNIPTDVPAKRFSLKNESNVCSLKHPGGFH